MVCRAYQDFYDNKPPFQSGTSEKCLVLFERKTLLNSMEKITYKLMVHAMGTKMAVAFANISMANIEKEILR